MSTIKLIKPSLDYEEQIWDYRQEFLDHGDSLDGTAGLQQANSAEEWIQSIERNSREETKDKVLVPASSYLLVRENDDRVVGMIQIRHRLNDYLLNFGGHIGYSVRKSERQKGFAKEMLRLALKKCSPLGLEKVLLTCDKNNPASAKTILANSGVLENEVQNNGRTTQRYWVQVN